MTLTTLQETIDALGTASIADGTLRRNPGPSLSASRRDSKGQDACFSSLLSVGLGFNDELDLDGRLQSYGVRDQIPHQEPGDHKFPQFAAFKWNKYIQRNPCRDFYQYKQDARRQHSGRGIEPFLPSLKKTVANERLPIAQNTQQRHQKSAHKDEKLDQKPGDLIEPRRYIM